MNIFRKLLIDALEDNGGYGGHHRSDRYPIAFNVKVNGSCDDTHIIDKLAQDDPKQAKLARYLMDNDLHGQVWITTTPAAYAAQLNSPD